MRPFFFNKNKGYQAAESRRVTAYRLSQSTMDRKKKRSGEGPTYKILKGIARFLAGGRRLASWEIALIADAQAKRERRKARNLRWWARDRNWHIECGRG
jgi:hypothetical protein